MADKPRQKVLAFAMCGFDAINVFAFRRKLDWVLFANWRNSACRVAICSAIEMVIFRSFFKKAGAHPGARADSC
ncbi:MAG: hypothetical protein ACK5QX_09945 [bacterium]